MPSDGSKLAGLPIANPVITLAPPTDDGLNTINPVPADVVLSGYSVDDYTMVV